jgi:poly(A) polymerase
MNTSSVLKTIAEVSRVTGVDIHVVGGFVRDELLGIEEKKDIDFVVMGSGVDFGEAFARHVGEDAGTLVTFAEFNTARFVFTRLLEDGKKEKLLEVEFAGARKESYRDTSRKPVVEPATLAEDMSRRDFRVNAMARSVTEGGELGEIYDPFDGRNDIYDRILRTPLDPDDTFFDDPLRMMRAARFAAQLGFSIDHAVLDAMVRNASRLEIISKERIQEEFFKLLSTKKPSIGLTILYGTRLFDYFLPEVNDLAGAETSNGYSHKDNLAHTFAVVDNIAEYSDQVLLRYAGLLHDIAKPATKKFSRGRGWTFDMHEHLGKKMAKDINNRLRLSVPDSKYVCKLVRWHLQPIALMDEGVTDSAVRRLIVNLGDDLEDQLILCRSDITTGNQKKKEKRLKNYDRLEIAITELMEKDKLRAFQSPVRGEEIMDILGLRPGPTVGKIKKELERAILDGDVPNDHEAVMEYFLGRREEFLVGLSDWERDTGV